ncbi:MAG TPA: DUF2167 domain-containing protein [Paenibacillus sp.]|jgi:uncharacterized membrane-anchored protein
MKYNRERRSGVDKRWKSLALTFIVLLWAVMSLPGPVNAAAEEEEVILNWVEGSGQQVTLGDKAKLTLQTGLVYLNGEDTVKNKLDYGIQPNNKEIGSVFPMDENESWVVYFDYDDVGHVKDEEKNDIDADALLQSYVEGTEEANKEREPERQLFVDGWDVAPVYDENLHSLKWSLLAHDNNKETIINYNVRLLTREGYVSAILVSDPAHLEADRKSFESMVLSNFSVNSGERYEDFDESTDKLAEYGLTGLIVGGAGLVVAKKVGLIALIVVFFKRFGVVVVAAIVGGWRVLRGRSKKKDEEPTYPNSNEPPTDQNM